MNIERRGFLKTLMAAIVMMIVGEKAQTLPRVNTLSSRTERLPEPVTEQPVTSYGDDNPYSVRSNVYDESPYPWAKDIKE